MTSENVLNGDLETLESLNTSEWLQSWLSCGRLRSDTLTQHLVDLEEKCVAATKLCNNVAFQSSPQRSIPIFLSILAPDFVSTPLEQKLRRIVFQILCGLPMPLLVEPYARAIVDRLMALLRVENEENGIIIVKTISNILCAHSKVLEKEVQQFLDLIKEMFNPMVQFHRVGSLKVLSECATAVASSFRADPSLVSNNFEGFAELIKAILMLQAKPQKRAHEERGEVFAGISKEVKNREDFGDFISMQVNVLALLGFLLRNDQRLIDFLSVLPDIIGRLLRDCPPERPEVRKALVITMRHLFNFHRETVFFFLKTLDELVDERTLIGNGLTFYETMRPLAYSMLADLIHHIRKSLNEDQIRRTIEIYTKNLHDDFPGTSFQTMSAKLLFNMTECIAQMKSKRTVRHFFIMILNAIGDKFAAMNRQLPTATKLSAQYTPLAIEAQAESYLAAKDDPPTWGEVGIANAMPIKTSNPYRGNSDLVADNKFLIRNLFDGLNNLFYKLHMTKPQKSDEEIEQKVFAKLFHEGFQVLRYYGVNELRKDTRNLTAELVAKPQEVGDEEKTLLETFATVFHHLHPTTFREIFSSHPPILHIARFLLASRATPPKVRSTLKKLLKDDLQPNVVNVRTQLSSFPVTVVKYLNRWCPEKMYNFAPMIKKSRGRNYADLLSNFSLKEGGEKEKVQAQINAIHFAHSLCPFKNTTDTIKNKSLREAILLSGKYIEKHLRNNDIDSSLRLAAEQAGEQVVDLLVAYLEQEPRDFEVFLEIVEAVTSGHLKSTPALFHFIYEHMIEAETCYRKAAILQCIGEIANRTTPQQVKTFLFQHVINPILAKDVSMNYATLFGPQASGTKLVDMALIEAIRVKLWQPTSTSFADGTKEMGKLEAERSRLELLQMTALLLKYHTNLMRYAQEDVVKVLRSWVDLEDVISKHATLVVISYFINVYESEVEFDIVKIYRYLLESNLCEVRALVSQALDLLAPVLTKRMGGAVSAGQRLPLWASIPKTIIVEQAHNVQHLISTFNFLARHHDLFYSVSSALAPSIISALCKIAQPPNPSNEDKKIALNLVNTIWLWEERTSKESLGLSPSASPLTHKWKVDGTHTEPTCDELKLTLIEYLFRFITDLPDRYPLSPIKPSKEQLKKNIMPAPPKETCRMAVRLLHDFIRLPSWADVDIDVFIQRFVEPVLTEDPAKVKQKEHATKVINGLQVLKVIVNDKPGHWIRERMKLWNKFLENLVNIDHAQVRECLRDKETGEKALDLDPPFDRILVVIQGQPKAADEDCQQFLQTYMQYQSTKVIDIGKNCVKTPAPFQWSAKTVTDSRCIIDYVAVIVSSGIAIAGLTLYWHGVVELKLLVYVAFPLVALYKVFSSAVAQPKERTLGRNNDV